MLHIDRVLFPTDRSEPAERAYVHALHLAAAHGAELHILHVTGEPRDSPQDLTPLTSQEVVTELNLESGRPAEPARIVQKEISGDRPADVILRYAEEQGVDLVVMGTHGRGGVERMILGSVAERVVRQAPCPVMTVRSSGGMQVNRILVPVDFSDLSKAVIPVAEDLAELYDARVELLYVIDEEDYPMENVPLLGPVHVSPDELEKRIRKLMRNLEREYGNGTEVTGTVIVGSPADSIIEHAQEHADLIVMATHGRTGLKRIVLGSVAEKVVRQAPVPVFSVKSFGRDPMKPA